MLSDASRLNFLSFNQSLTVCFHDLFVFFQTFPSRNYSHLSVIIKEFLAELKLPELPLAACMAVAGPVKNNHCHVTNLV